MHYFGLSFWNNFAYLFFEKLYWQYLLPWNIDLSLSISSFANILFGSVSNIYWSYTLCTYVLLHLYLINFCLFDIAPSYMLSVCVESIRLCYPKELNPTISCAHFWGPLKWDIRKLDEKLRGQENHVYLIDSCLFFSFPAYPIAAYVVRPFYATSCFKISRLILKRWFCPIISRML